MSRSVTEMPLFRMRQPARSSLLRVWLPFAVVAALSVVAIAADFTLSAGTLKATCTGSSCLTGQLSEPGAAAVERMGISIQAYVALLLGLNAITGLVWLGVASYVLVRRQEPGYTLLIAGTLALGGAIVSSDRLAQAGGPWGNFGSAVNFAAFFALVTSFHAFPDGRFIPRWVVGVLAIYALVEFPGAILPGTRIDASHWAPALSGTVWLGAFISAAVVQAYRYRSIATAQQRQQVKWVVLGLATSAFGIAAYLAGGLAIPPFRAESSFYRVAFPLVVPILLVLIPVSVGLATTRYRLWDVDPLINRAVVYGGLSVALAAAFVAVSAYVGMIAGSITSPVASAVGAAAAALLLQPVRLRLERWANRLTYGQPEDPLLVLDRLAEEVAAAPRREELPAAIVEQLALALRISDVSLWRTDNGVMRRIASAAPHPPQPAVVARDAWKDGLLRSGAASLPVAHAGMTLGALVISRQDGRPPGEQFKSEAVRRILPLLGAILDGIRLDEALSATMADLRDSRLRIVTAQEEERRRIQRDLHDGLGPTLAAMRLRLEAAMVQAETTTPDLAADLERVDELLGETSGEVRRLVQALRPPVLGQLGLARAIRQLAEQFSRDSGVCCEVEVTPVPGLSAAAEVALFRAAQESLTNVAKHAHASAVRLTLLSNGETVTLTVADDGKGSLATSHEGLGLKNIRDRASILEGAARIEMGQSGTIVTVCLPIASAGESTDA